MKRTVFSLLAAFALCVSAAAAGPAVSCPSALLMEKQTGTVLFAQDEHTPREPASVTKIMTLLLVMEAIDSGALSYDDVVTGSAHAAGMGGSQIWLKENEQMTVRDLLKAVCIVSGNDAAVALAEHLAGSEDAFVERMNARAQELGMNDTHFVNCTGLPAAGHLTSACDIALMSRELILHHPDIRQFTTVWMDSLRGGESMLVNTNKLIRFYDGATGLKTGSTGSAGYCLSATAEKNGMELIAVVLKGKTSDERFSDAKSLLNYGFSTWSLVTVTPDEVLPPVPVMLGVRGTVQPVLTSENTLLVEKTLANGLTKEVALAESVAAPVYAGDTLGQLTVRDAAGNTVAELPILAGEDVGHVTFVQMLGRCLARGFCMGPQS
ncbi:MAG: D-alanyl-D-alanine carboxypeptidase [Oscillibacter sp.]|nr:D-alanyl-D-alanine carboxypeptidase [Oscillospiraceae bacterium]MCI6785031.1 D-alanyl-D-alanine carboxypeptidase [Clostridiales bacterium]MDD7509580.1 D-alanyl-D-alanine carboxypeptidase [Oscillibacter sp.]MDY5710937.1 D-alanyl-D-alanine carboxypeptidase family protein [Oscillospiraceae bacterium]MDY5805903.1 D-alanyl-D-alanine carboxypeptidase family protein [Oscillospiraceae bacterium]